MYVCIGMYVHLRTHIHIDTNLCIICISSAASHRERIIIFERCLAIKDSEEAQNWQTFLLFLNWSVQKK